MNRPSSPWATGSVTDRIHDDADDEFADVEDYDAYADYDDDDDFDDYDDVRYYTDHDDRRWLWVASVAGIVLLIAVAGTLMILSGGDSGTTSATVSPSDKPARAVSQRCAHEQDTVGDRAAAGDHHKRHADADRRAAQRHRRADRSRAAACGQPGHRHLHRDR